MERHVLIPLRVATNVDFADSNGNKKLNVPYLFKNSLGVIETKIYYFNEETDLFTFKSCYANNQIYVFNNPNEVKASTNCIDWDLIDKELDYELNQLQLINKTA